MWLEMRLLFVVLREQVLLVDRINLTLIMGDTLLLPLQVLKLGLVLLIELGLLEEKLLLQVSLQLFVRMGLKLTRLNKRAIIVCRLVRVTWYWYKVTALEY